MTERLRSTKVAEFAALAFLLIIASAAIYLAVWGQSNQEEANVERSAKETAQTGQAEEQGEKKDLATQVAEACKAGGDVAKNLTQRGLCGKAKEIIQEPKVTPTVPVPQPTNTTTTVVVPARGPSPSETLKAVTAFCAAKSSPCKGRAPTPAEVATAVATYCNPKGECRGPEGPEGPEGKQGPGPTAEQVAAGVVAFCGQDSDPCRGPKGADGRSLTFAVEAVTGGTKVTISFEDGTGAQSFLIPDGQQGPAGPAGPPGPICPEGSTPKVEEVMTTGGPITANLCVIP